MSDRRAKGLCYWCDEKFTPEHYQLHKKTQLYSLEVEDDSEVEDDTNRSDVEDGETTITPHVSVNAVSGISDFNTMRVRGNHGKRSLFVLLDSGSTHNFLDPVIAAKLGCEVTTSGLSRVTVADGRKLGVQGKVEKFEWSFQAHDFQTEVMLIPLQGCDMVLGIQWLATLGPITWEFKKLEMSFRLNNKKVVLQGLKNGSVRDVRAQKLNKLQESQIQLAMISVKEVEDQNKNHKGTAVVSTKERLNSPVLEAMLARFSEIFEEPVGLPPFRDHHDHKIRLMEGSNPVNQRPYRYSIHQKNEIDKIVEEMLCKGTIQISSSPFASPVVLVKKKDGS